MSKFHISGLLAAVALFTLSLTFASTILATSTAQEGTVVEMRDNLFVPETLTVPVGTTLTWQNVGQNPHTATADDDTFDTGTVNPGQSAALTLNTPGTFPYHCQFHGAAGGVGMVGTIIVEATQPTRQPTPAPQPMALPETGVASPHVITLGVIATCTLLAGIGIRRSLRCRTGAG